MAVTQSKTTKQVGKKDNGYQTYFIGIDNDGDWSDLSTETFKNLKDCKNFYPYYIEVKAPKHILKEGKCLGTFTLS